MDKVAVIGAGISGLALANKLKKHFEVVVFEKSRGYGGRVATRRAHEFIFDHGAQFFKVKTDEFKEYIKPMIDQDIIDIWRARFVEIDNGKITNERIRKIHQIMLEYHHECYWQIYGRRSKC